MGCVRDHLCLEKIQVLATSSRQKCQQTSCDQEHFPSEIRYNFFWIIRDLGRHCLIGVKLGLVALMSCWQEF